MIMIDHSKRLARPVRWTRAGKLLAAGCSLLLVVAVTLGIVLSSPAPGHGPGCINVTFASTLGGADFNACGSQARRICLAPQSYPHLASALRAECRRVGYPTD
jgi:hypothetical protein